MKLMAVCEVAEKTYFEFHNITKVSEIYNHL